MSGCRANSRAIESPRPREPPVRMMFFFSDIIRPLALVSCSNQYMRKASVYYSHSAPPRGRAEKMKRKQPVQSRAQATCAAIVDATVQVILRDGVSHLTTGRVAERAGVSIGTLYQYFSNKDDLIAAVRARHVTFLISAAAQAIDLAQHHSHETVLRRALEDFLRFKRENLALSRALIGLAGTPETQDTPADVNRRFAELLVPLLRDHPGGADRLTQAVF